MVDKVLQQEYVKAANKAQYWYHTILSTALSPTSGPQPSSLKLVAKDSKLSNRATRRKASEQLAMKTTFLASIQHSPLHRIA